MIEWTTLWAGLAKATEQLRGMKAVWGIVALAIAAQIANLSRGSDRAAVVGVAFAAVGIIVVLLLLTLTRAPRRGQPRSPLQPLAMKMARAVALTFNLLLAMLLVAVLIGWPCNMADLLGLRLHPNCGTNNPWPWPVAAASTTRSEAGVHIARTVDYRESKCDKGERVLKEVVTDNLRFEGNTDDYVIQAMKNTVATELGVLYQVEGKDTPEKADWQPHTASSEMWRFPVPVKNNRTRIIYTWNQRPTPDDNLFTAVAIASSRDILSLEATILLPAGKKILGPSEHAEHKRYIDLMRQRGCVMRLTDPVTFTCKDPLRNVPNVAMIYPVKWDVFSECEPLPATENKKPA